MIFVVSRDDSCVTTADAARAVPPEVQRSVGRLTVARPERFIREERVRLVERRRDEDYTKRSAFHSMPSSLGGPMYPRSADAATTDGEAR
jgi:hypothetical protein